MTIHKDTQLVVVNSLDDLFTFKEWLGQRKDVIGVDTETTGLTWQNPTDDLRLVQIGDMMNGFVFPWHQWGGAFMEALTSWDGAITFHNSVFDLKFLSKFANWDIPWNQIHDTLIMAKVVFPGQPATLKGMSEKYIDPRADIGKEYLDKAMKDNGWGWDTVPIDHPAYTNYSALDPVLSAHLYDFLINHPNFHQEAYELEMSYLRIAYGMEKQGMRIDVPYCEEQANILDEYTVQAKEYGQEEFGISIGSSKQIIEYMLSQGAEFTQRTPKGFPSANADQLEEFSTDPNPDISDLANLILEARKAEKIKSSYFENFVEMNVDGILYPSINTMGAVTGRQSIRNPALQTLPSGSNIVRNAFIPRNEGEVIVTCDSDQVEARVFAVLCGDEHLQSAFHTADSTGSDFFTEIGKLVYNDPQMTKADDRRKLIKTYWYASLYGSGIKKMAKSANVSEHDMQEVANKIATRFPAMKKYQNDTTMTTEHRGYVETMLTGRKLPVESDKAYKGVNYTIQGSCAEFLKRSLIEMDARGIGENILLPVHDEVIASCAPEDAEEVKQIMQECMTVSDYAVELTAGPEGPIDRWGSKY